MYNIRYVEIHSTYPDDEYDYIVEDLFWGDFETHLGEVDEGFILDTHTADLGLENDDPVDIDMDEDQVAERMKGIFSEWVFNTLDKRENYYAINEYMEEYDFRVEFDQADFVVVFNYTHILQNSYDGREVT